MLAYTRSNAVAIWLRVSPFFLRKDTLVYLLIEATYSDSRNLIAVEISFSKSEGVAGWASDPLGVGFVDPITKISLYNGGNRKTE